MQKNIVDYRYSDSDFVAYLMTLGHKPKEIELKRKEWGTKIFIHFSEEKGILEKIYEQYIANEIMVNLTDLFTNRKQLIKSIKAEQVKIKKQRKQ